MSWQKVKLGDLCTIEKGKTGIQKAIPGEYPLVVTSEERKTNNEFQFDDEAVIIPLVSGTGHGHASIKRLHFQKGKFALGSILCAVIPKDKNTLNADYLFRFLTLNKDRELVDRMKGMANVTLPIKEIAKIEIPLPPLKEQIKFIEKYQILEFKNGLISEEFSKQIDLIKQLRQAFLREAMQGLLVKTETNGETGAQLLEKIKAEKAQLVKDKKLKKEKELPPISEEEIPFEIPEHWAWCRLGEISNIKRGISPKYSQNGVFKMLNQKCIRWFNITSEYSKAIDKEWFENLSEDFYIATSDILVNSTGEGTIGRSAIVDETINRYTFDSHVLRVRSSINQTFICQLINSDFGQKLIDKIKGATSTKQTELGVNNLSNFIIPLPPLFEQDKIVAKLDELMAFCDGLEESIKASQGVNEKLLQEVLREALQGEGVNA